MSGEFPGNGAPDGWFSGGEGGAGGAASPEANVWRAASPDDVTTQMPQVNGGAIKAYAVTAKSRLAVAPDIPTVDEAGLPGFYFSFWHAIWVPKGTPKDIIGQGYTLGMIIRQALEKAASRDPKKIREVLASSEFTNLPYPATKVKFGDNGLNTYNKEVLAEWMKGELRTVWPKEVQTIEPSL